MSRKTSKRQFERVEDRAMFTGICGVMDTSHPAIGREILEIGEFVTQSDEMTLDADQYQIEAVDLIRNDGWKTSYRFNVLDGPRSCVAQGYRDGIEKPWATIDGVEAVDPLSKHGGRVIVTELHADGTVKEIRYEAPKEFSGIDEFEYTVRGRGNRWNPDETVSAKGLVRITVDSVERPTDTIPSAIIPSAPESMDQETNVPEDENSGVTPEPPGHPPVDVGSPSAANTSLLPHPRVTLVKGDLRIEGTYGNDWVKVSEANGELRVAASNGHIDMPVQYTSVPSTAVQSIQFEGNDGNDTFTNDTGIPAVVDGGRGDDLLVGGNGSDTIFGGIGNDRVFGRGGHDQLYGGDGDDILSGGAGNDSIVGGHGRDAITGGPGNDRLEGNEGADSIDGGDGHDHIWGGRGNDSLKGGSGNDGIHGNEGSDHIEGGIGNDVLLGQSGADLIEGGVGNDRLFGAEGDDRIFGMAGVDYIYGGIGNDYIDAGAGDDGVQGGPGNDRIVGGDGNDILWGQDDDDEIDGGNGADQIHGHGGNDILRGGNGDDKIWGYAGNDQVFGDGGNDFVWAGNGNDIVRGGKGHDTVLGENGDDIVFGGKGNDSLDGGKGRDDLRGGNGDDRLYGRKGRDVLRGGSGADLLYGGKGNDLLVSTDRVRDNDRLWGMDGEDEFDAPKQEIVGH